MKVVACTPTKNRRWSWNFSRTCMGMQIRKPDLWVILDNSSTPADDWSPAKERDGVLYERVYEPRPIGWMRNRCLEIALAEGADYIVFWDDDDYYPPTRISGGIQTLEANPTADISGCSKMYLLLTKENVFLETGPCGETHATAATWTIRRKYAESHRFVDDKVRGEEVDFTASWSAKLVQVSPEECIVVIGHGRNTVNKSVLLETPDIFRAKVLNRDNGKMMFRARWPVPWDTFRTTFYT